MTTMLFNSRGAGESRHSAYVRGAGSIFNLRGNTHREYRFAANEREADLCALGNDWEVVAADFTEAVTQYRRRSGR